MAAERKFIEVEDNPDLAAIARAVNDSGQEVILREAGQKIAVLRPLCLSERIYEEDSKVR